MGGQTPDATVVQARAARLTVEEKTVGRDGGTPAGRSPARRARIDGDARWTLKRDRKRPWSDNGTSRRQQVEIAVPVLGYKRHVGIDLRHGLIRTWDRGHGRLDRGVVHQPPV
jgi:hypothetical protein